MYVLKNIKPDIWIMTLQIDQIKWNWCLSARISAFMCYNLLKNDYHDTKRITCS